MTKPLGWIAATVSVISLLITSAVWSAVERIEIVEPRAVFSVKGGMSSCDVVVALLIGSKEESGERIGDYLAQGRDDLGFEPWVAFEPGPVAW